MTAGRGGARGRGAGDPGARGRWSGDPVARGLGTGDPVARGHGTGDPVARGHGTGDPGSPTAASRVAALLPERLVAATARAVYPRFEPELTHLAELCPADCGTAVDVGGWYGPWTWRLSARARRVVTVEPVPRLARLLTSTAPSNVRVIQAAAADHPGTARLWLPTGDTGARGLSSLVRRDVHGHAVPVRCVALDGLGLRDVGFVKIDVDGSELAVLRGATGLLTRDRPALLVELESRIQPVGPVVTYLRMLGYEGWVLPGDRWVPLSGFPLESHQAGTGHLASVGLVRRVLPPRRRRYVNSVLFLPKDRRPREPGPGPGRGRADRMSHDGLYVLGFHTRR